jgi:hypothetical protein
LFDRQNEGDDMFPRMRMFAVAVCLVAVASAADASAQGPARDAKGDGKALEGLWSGAWGGGGRDGVVFLPVIAKMLIKGDHIELRGFPDAQTLTGTVRFVAGAKRIRITPAAGAEPAPKPIEYAYELKGDSLTLTGGDNVQIGLQKVRIVHNPLANAQVELIAASGFNERGDLVVTDVTVLRAGKIGATYLQSEKRTRSIKQATVLLVQDKGMKKVTLDDARRLLRDSTPVVVTYRQDDRASPELGGDLWKFAGPALPDSEAVQQTLARILRPGTLVFVLFARENTLQP